MAGVLDLLIQWNSFILTPAAPAAEALHARANIHAHVATTGASPLHFELVELHAGRSILDARPQDLDSLQGKRLVRLSWL